MHITFTQPVPWFSTPFSVSLRPLGLTALTPLRGVLLKNRRLVRKKKLFCFNQIYFLKSRLRSAIKTGESHPERAWS